MASKPTIWVIEVPLPPKQTRPNFGVHSQASIRARNRAKRNQAWAARLAAKEAIGRRRAPKLEWPTIRSAFYFESRRNFCDPDNLIGWMKKTLDGLQAAGLIANDRKVHLVGPEQDVDARRPRLRIVVEPCRGAA